MRKIVATLIIVSVSCILIYVVARLVGSQIYNSQANVVTNHNSDISIVSIIGGFVELGGALLAGVVTLLYTRKVRLQTRKRKLTQRERYVIPLLMIAGMSLIPGIGVVLMMIPTASPQVTYEAWVLFPIFPLSCSGGLFIGLVFSYLVTIKGL